MSPTKITALVAFGLAMLFLGLYTYSYTPPQNVSGVTVLSENRLPLGTSCYNTTPVPIPIGNSTTTLLAASSTRAYARISQPLNATTSPIIVFGEGSLVKTQPTLTAATATSPIPYIEFGLLTPFPFTGTVTASSTASTTVNVIECGF